MERHTNFHPMTDRYHFDFKLCTTAAGWAQVDTRQDASYFGTWTHPTKRETVCYCEGDITHTKCENDEEYVTHLRELVAWNIENETWIGIDPYGVKEAHERFATLGLTDLLH